METAAGATVGTEELRSVMNHRSGIGLAEFMNYPGVINYDPDVISKINLFNKVMPNLFGEVATFRIR